eukprot:GFUD01095204.1.p1 GENE.GFUD01095204.1~~GFUD01095204.1.p1  ORF type:complete len:186 (+),score=33.74 GFUD01095204.1:72-629(+)
MFEVEEAPEIFVSNFHNKLQQEHLHLHLCGVVGHKEAGHPGPLQGHLLVTHFLVQLGHQLHVVLFQLVLKLCISCNYSSLRRVLDNHLLLLHLLPQGSAGTDASLSPAAPRSASSLSPVSAPGPGRRPRTTAARMEFSAGTLLVFLQPSSAAEIAGGTAWPGSLLRVQDCQASQLQWNISIMEQS